MEGPKKTGVLISYMEQQRVFWEEAPSVWITIWKALFVCIVSLTVQDTMLGKKQLQRWKY